LNNKAEDRIKYSMKILNKKMDEMSNLETCSNLCV